MNYTTTYDIGARKRKRNGINEDSIAVTIYQDGHRDGYSPGWESDSENRGTSNGEPGDETETATGVFTVNPEDTDEPADHRDSEPVDRTAGIFVLADGAGGEDAGDIASYLATTVIPAELAKTVQSALRQTPDCFGIEAETQAIGDPPSPAEIEDAIVDAINDANREIVRYATETGSDGMYTTIVVGVKLGNKLHYGWVGDSRVYVINEGHDEIALLTKDHAEVQRLEDQGKIDQVEAHVHPDGNRIDRAVGGGSGHDPEAARVRVDTETVELYDDDVVVFTSDGLIDAQTDAEELYYEYKKSGEDEETAEKVLENVVTDDDIREIVTEELDIDAAAEQFIDFSNQKGGKDNISLILFRDDTLPSSPPVKGGLPEREADPDITLAERETIIK